ncbi:MAG TPA: MtrB/PioB family outer membrane beta-barrel protein [Burkholderiales bacterium]
MKPKLLSILVASVFVPALAQAQEPQREWSGSISIGVRDVGLNTNDPSKFTEYRDLRDGASVFGGLELRRRGPNDYLNAYGENIGRDDQYLDLNGGRYGTYKYRVYSDLMRHNFGSGPGALSPFNGIGSNVLTATLPNTNPATWNTFDHSYKRHNFGGMVELQATSPWYFRVDANEVKRDGINVFAGAKGTSPGNGFMDLPSPIDYTAKNVSGEVGFSNRRGHFAVNLLKSTFDNGNETLRWQNNFYGGLDTTMLPPSNELTRLGINGNIRGLPVDSTLAARYTNQKTTSDVTMLQNILSTPASGGNPATNPSEPSFKGDHRHTTWSLSLASRPTAAVDTKVYWNYDKLKNESTEMIFNPSTTSALRAGSTDPRVNCANVAGVVCEPEAYHYTKKNYGAEAGVRLTRNDKLSAGLDFTHVDRLRSDFEKTKETRLFGEWKNNQLDWLTGRVKYQYLTRNSDFDENNAAVFAANPMDFYVRRFDLANVHQHLVKLVLDANPVPLVDVGFEVIYKRNRYINTILGRTDDQRQEYYASFGWGDPKAIRVLAFGDIEYTTYDSNHRVGLGDPNPAAAPTTTTYNWSARNKDTAWQVGLGADWALLTRFMIKSSFVYMQTNGRADFSVQPGGATTAFRPIENFDNTRRLSLNVKGIYEYSRNIELTAGYAYERYRFSDIGTDGTKYVVPGAGGAEAYTTGQFAFQPYSANVVYGIAKYKF